LNLRVRMRSLGRLITGFLSFDHSPFSRRGWSFLLDCLRL
jgi:hypothetical protein